MSIWYILIILSPNPSFSGFWKSPSFSPLLASVPFLVKLLSWFCCVFPISKCWSHLQDLVPSLFTFTGKESTCNAGDTGDMGLIPRSGRSPGRGNGNPPQYSCLENPVERGAWQAITQRVTKSRTWTRAWLDCPGKVYQTHDIKYHVYSALCEDQWKGTWTVGTHSLWIHGLKGIKIKTWTVQLFLLIE